VTDDKEVDKVLRLFNITEDAKSFTMFVFKLVAMVLNCCTRGVGLTFLITADDEDTIILCCQDDGKDDSPAIDFIAVENRE